MSNERATQIPSAAKIDMRLEVVVLPVSDVDRAKRFYGNLGWREDADFAVGTEFAGGPVDASWVAMLDPLRQGVTPAAPGSTRNLYLVVSDIVAARGDFRSRRRRERSVPPSPPPGDRHAGPGSQRNSYGSFATFSDPDGNSWLLQEITTRLPDEDSAADVATLTELLREAEEHHGRYEPTAPKHHWSGVVRRLHRRARARQAPEEAAKDAALHIEGVRR